MTDPSQINNSLNQQLPTNNSGKITAAVLRGALTTGVAGSLGLTAWIVATFAGLTSPNTFTGANIFASSGSVTVQGPFKATGSVTLPAGVAATNIGTLSGDLTGALPSPTIAAGAITAAKMSAGVAATNIGTLSGDLTGTLPSPTIAAGAITAAKMSAGSAATNLGGGTAQTGILVGNGTSAATAITPGTGVAAALGSSVGSAGSIVVTGGALGAPSSGDLSGAGVVGVLKSANNLSDLASVSAALKALGIKPVNEFPDPQLQVTSLTATNAENAALTGQVSALSISSVTIPVVYATGTATFTNGSTAVVGVGTAWSGTLQANDWIQVPSVQCSGRLEWYGIASVTDNTHLTLTRNWGGNCAETTQSGVAYLATGYFTRNTPNQRLLTINASNTYNLKNNDLVYLSGGTAGTPLDLTCQYTYRAQNVVANTSFQIMPEYRQGCTEPAVGMTATSFTIARPGDFTGGNSGSISIGLQRYGNGSYTPTVSIDDDPTRTVLFQGARRILIVQKVTAGTEYVYWMPQNSTGYGAWAGQCFSSGMAVVIPSAASGASATEFINWGSGLLQGNTVTTVGSRLWTSMTTTVGAAPTTMQAGILLTGPVGTWFFLGEFYQSKTCNSAWDGVFSTPTGQVVTAISSYSPFNHAEISGPATIDAVNGLYSWDSDMYAASNGTIGPGVTSIWTLAEGQTDCRGQVYDTACNGEASIGWRSAFVSPVIFGGAMYQNRAQPTGSAGTFATAAGWIPIENGYMWGNIGGPDVRWRSYSWDASKFELFTGTN